jgi:hypothetical protein
MNEQGEKQVPRIEPSCQRMMQYPLIWLPAELTAETLMVDLFVLVQLQTAVNVRGDELAVKESVTPALLFNHLPKVQLPYPSATSL